MEINLGPSFQLDEAPFCPVCRAKLDGVTVVSRPGKVKPCPGDFSVCVYCASLLRYTIGLRLVKATAEGLREFGNNQPEEFAMLMKVVDAARQMIFERRRGNYRGN